MKKFKINTLAVFIFVLLVLLWFLNIHLYAQCKRPRPSWYLRKYWTKWMAVKFGYQLLTILVLSAIITTTLFGK